MMFFMLETKQNKPPIKLNSTTSSGFISKKMSLPQDNDSPTGAKIPSSQARSPNYSVGASSYYFGGQKPNVRIRRSKSQTRNGSSLLHNLNATAYPLKNNFSNILFDSKDYAESRTKSDHQYSSILTPLLNTPVIREFRLVNADDLIENNTLFQK